MLKALELFGFKSFADKTKFDFSTGITAVVGPNGSGKSNVVDALKWILGDQSPKSLRGKEMTDVIFNGAANRKASSFAEATLTLDNSSGFLEIDSSEVQIGRRLWRSGDSEYLINRQTARLRDIRDLLMGTGAGASAYCIIEQGRVDQILQANASTRRTVFEEAAGISRYKARKTEALRKLERVEQNLLRLQDIVGELESQLTSLRGQASRAARFRDLTEQLREHWVGLAADDYRLLQHRWQELQTRSQSQSDEVQVLVERHVELEQALKRTEDSLAVVEDDLRRVEQKHAARREQVASDESTIRHQTVRRRELMADLSRLKRQQRELRQRTFEAQQEYAHLAQVVQNEEADLQQQMDAVRETGDLIEQQAAELAAERNRGEGFRNKLLESLREISEKQGRVSHLQRQLEETIKDQSNLSQQVESVVQAEQLAVVEVNHAEQAFAEARDQFAQSERELQGIQNSRESLLGEQDETRRSLAQMRETHSAWEARRSVLEDLESRQEGLGIGVREILQRAANSTYRPWTDVLGSVADLLDVDLDQAALMEVALGARSQLIVVTQLQPFLDYVQKESTLISGRVGFLSIEDRVAGNSVPEGPLTDLPDLSQEPGVLMRADRLAQSPPGAPGLAEQLLADTWVVETLDVAVKLAQGPGRVCRFVTLQGELLEAGRTLFAGRVHNETALVSRKSELRRLRSDLVRLATRMESEEQRLDTLVARLSEKKNLLSEAEQSLARVGQLVEDARAARDANQQRLNSIRVDKDRLLAAVDSLENRRKTTERELEQAQADLLTLEHDRTDVQREADQSDLLVSRLEVAVQAHKVEQASVQGALEKQRTQLQETRDALGRLGRERRQRAAELEEATARLTAGEKRLRDATLQLLNCRASLAERVVDLEGLAREAQERFHDKVNIRSERSRLLDEDAEIQAHRRKIDDRIHQDEMANRDLRHQMNVLEARIREEFQLELPDVVDTEASAFRLHFLRSAEASNSEHDSDGTELPGSVVEDPDGFAGIRPELEEELDRIRRKLKHLGHVNTDSLESLDELEQRFNVLNEQLQDLLEARDSLEEIIRKINAESRRLFQQTFTTIRGHFQELFRKLFGGGEGDVVLEDPDDILDCGIDIVARPPGKELRSLSLLSGGEKTLTAVALLLAIFRSRPSPFCILDEVDAALDEANVERFVQVLKDFQSSTQFIMISHRKPSMAAADVLYGVTMEESGVSKRMSVRFDQINEAGEFIGKPDETQAA